jgi:hypothetical protein
MGLSLEFYAGDAAVIGAAFNDVADWDSIRDGTKAIAYADLSLHLSPDALDTLSEVFAMEAGAGRMEFLSRLGEEVGVIDGGEGGAYVVEPAWVQTVAKVDPRDAKAITVRWFDSLGKVYNSVIEVNPGAIAAVASLIELCKKAVKSGVSVVFAWSH